MQQRSALPGTQPLAVGRGRGAPAQIDVVVAPNGAVIYAGFGQAGTVPGRE